MNTPIYDFLTNYSKSNISRLHMPGHKGVSFLGCENLDITEIEGADDLYNPSGIISESENNASKIFETGATFYSCEGSSLSIRTMIYAAYLANNKGHKKIAAVRNVHKSFITACVLLDIDIVWIYPENASNLCSGTATPDEIGKCLKSNTDVFALFLTSPNYLGELTDITSVSKVCKKYNIPLLVDNAHGAYLKFCNMHPIELGADMCCDSAHKTLPVLTGGAYLHISKGTNFEFRSFIKRGMTLFGSTSPSYLIMASLDLCNKYLYDNYSLKLKRCIEKVTKLKELFISCGFEIIGNEPLKITISCNGIEVSKKFRKAGLECEYCDKTVLVFMFSPENTDIDYTRVAEVMQSIRLKKTTDKTPRILPGDKALTVREAYLSNYETIDVKKSLNRVCAFSSVSCPPAVPIAVGGEIITKNTIEALEFYEIKEIDVIKTRTDL